MTRYACYINGQNLQNKLASIEYNYSGSVISNTRNTLYAL